MDGVRGAQPGDLLGRIVLRRAALAWPDPRRADPRRADPAWSGGTIAVRAVGGVRDCGGLDGGLLDSRAVHGRAVHGRCVVTQRTGGGRLAGRARGLGGDATALGRATAAAGWATAPPGLGLSRVPLKPLRTGHLRRRLTVAFVLVAATAAAVLGASSYVLVRNARLQDSLDRAAQDARFQLLLSRQFVPVPAKREDLLASFESTGHHVVLVSGTELAASDPEYDPAIPASLRATAAAGGLGYARVSDAGRALLLVGGRVPGTSAQLYTVAAEDTVRADLGQLRNVILASWAAVVLLAAMIGHVLARRILDPVARAGATARSVAEDLLGSPPATGPSDEFGSWVATFHQLATALRERTAALGEARDRERRFAAG
ncbi:MAG: two-component system, OmpR family, sensor histidine kinase MtrB, partial [Cryptosporangiaceae bacterium]|nr:two-component system, OmpR family, sensor histidine kinase MtrB [Cryptosporangiaceae bacterium]